MLPRFSIAVVKFAACVVRYDYSSHVPCATAALLASPSPYARANRFFLGGEIAVTIRFLCASFATLCCLTAPLALFAQPVPEVDDDPAPALIDDDNVDEGDALPAIPVPGDTSDFDPDDVLNTDDIWRPVPSLSSQQVNPLEGGSRGAPTSIFDSSRAIDIIGPQQINEANAPDLAGILQHTPGVMIQRTGRGQASPFVRGLTGQQVLILVDGIRMSNATFRAGPNQYFNTIDPNTVERIDVIRGPGSVLYGGDAIGGVINVVTKKSEITGYDWTTGTTVHRFSTADLGYSGRLNVEGATTTYGIFAGGGYGNFNDLDIGGAPDAPAGFDPGRQPATSWRYSSADLKFNYALTDFDEMIVAFQHYEGEDIFRTDRFPQNRETIFDPQQRDLMYVRFQGEDCCGWLNSYQITGSIHRTKEGRIDSRPIGTLDAIREFTDEQSGVSAVFGTDLGCGGWLTYGVDWYHDEIDSSINNPDADNDQPQFPNDAWYSRYGVFLQWEGDITCRLRANAGVRYEHIATAATVIVDQGPPITTSKIDPEYQDWVGSFGLTYEVNSCLNLVGSISEGFRAPNLDDLTALNDNVFVGTQVPNPDLDPETSITYEVGAKLDYSRFRGQAFVWWTDLQDHILRGAPTPQDLLVRTNKDSFLQGVEASGEYLLSCCWSAYGNFWYTFGRDNIDNVPLSRIPPTQGILGLRRRWNEGKEWFDVYTWLVHDQDRLSPRDESDTNRIPVGGTPGYITLNMRYGRLISERQRIAVNFENILDEQYRVHGSGSDGAGIGAILTYEILH